MLLQADTYGIYGESETQAVVNKIAQTTIELAIIAIIIGIVIALIITRAVTRNLRHLIVLWI
ncbi:MAG: hypothetical protein ACLT33_01385 [Lachnospira pectinoschiza]